MTAYEITFRIVTPNAPNSAKVVAHLAEIFRTSLGLPEDSAAWQAVAPKLLHSQGVRVRLSAEQFARFVVGRRTAAAGDELLSAGESTYRLKWDDPVEVTQGEAAA